MLDREYCDAENRRFKKYAHQEEELANIFERSANGYGKGREDDRTTGYHTVAAKARELKRAIEDATE